jgi:hypothetical protein
MVRQECDKGPLHPAIPSDAYVISAIHIAARRTAMSCLPMIHTDEEIHA